MENKFYCIMEYDDECSQRGIGFATSESAAVQICIQHNKNNETKWGYVSVSEMTPPKKSVGVVFLHEVVFDREPKYKGLPTTYPMRQEPMRHWLYAKTDPAIPVYQEVRPFGYDKKNPNGYIVTVRQATNNRKRAESKATALLKEYLKGES